MSSIDPMGISALYSSTPRKKTKKKEKEKDIISKKQPFSKILDEKQQVAQTDILLPAEIEGKPFDEALQFLVDSVYSKGDLLKKNTTPENFKEYHKVLSGFMRFVTKNSYTIETIKRGTRLRKKQPFKIVQTINTKLEELARGILSNQRDQIDLLAKVDEINGLVIDVLS
ncbi:MAG TPA: YaaR family protein [Treponemataceae bacterium]|nr:YaaR family protein [Treponemataceae bacterium]